MTQTDNLRAAAIPADGQRLAASSTAGRTLKRVTLRRRVFDFFNDGLGSVAAAPVIDLHFLIWRFFHPGANFANYYAGSIARELQRGATHKTLGRKKFLSGSPFSTPETWTSREHRTRATKYLELVVAYGLRPEHRCVDYGCGSLRVGQHLIAYQNSGNYRGMDVVDDFYESGKFLLHEGLIENKRPLFDIIKADVLYAARLWKPDFIFSFAVLKHVHPGELDAYFRNIAGMMAPHTQAVITFNEAARTSRTGAKIWDYSRDQLLASIESQGRGLTGMIAPLKKNGGNNILPRTSVLLMRRDRISPPADLGQLFESDQDRANADQGDANPIGPRQLLAQEQDGENGHENHA